MQRKEIDQIDDKIPMIKTIIITEAEATFHMFSYIDRKPIKYVSFVNVIVPLLCEVFSLFRFIIVIVTMFLLLISY